MFRKMKEECKSQHQLIGLFPSSVGVNVAVSAALLHINLECFVVDSVEVFRKLLVNFYLIILY